MQTGILVVLFIVGVFIVGSWPELAAWTKSKWQKRKSSGDRIVVPETPTVRSKADGEAAGLDERFAFAFPTGKAKADSEANARGYQEHIYGGARGGGKTFKQFESAARAAAPEAAKNTSMLREFDDLINRINLLSESDQPGQGGELLLTRIRHALGRAEIVRFHVARLLEETEKLRAQSERPSPKRMASAALLCEINELKFKIAAILKPNPGTIEANESYERRARNAIAQCEIFVHHVDGMLVELDALRERYRADKAAHEAAAGTDEEIMVQMQLTLRRSGITDGGHWVHPDIDPRLVGLLQRGMLAATAAEIKTKTVPPASERNAAP